MPKPEGVSMSNRDWNDKVLRYLERMVALGGGDTTDMVVDAFGFPVRDQRISLFSGFFTYGIGTAWRTRTTEDATVDSVDGSLVLDAGTVDGGIAACRSTRTPHYHANRGHNFSTATQTMPAPGAGAIVRVGMFSRDYGVYFEWDAANETLYGCVRQTTGTTAPNPEDHTESDPVGTTVVTKQEITVPDGFDITKNALWDIQYQWRGSGDIFFYINLALCATVKRLQVESSLSFSVPSLPATMEIENVGGSSGQQAEFGCVDITSNSAGAEIYSHAARIANATSATLSNSETALLAIRPSQYLHGKTNGRDLHLHRMTVSVDDESRIRVYKNVDSLTASWTPLSTVPGESSTQTSVPSAFTIGSGAKLVDITSPTGFEREFTIGSASIYLSADPEFNYQDTLLITGDKRSGGTTQVTVSMEMGEQE